MDVKKWIADAYRQKLEHPGVPESVEEKPSPTTVATDPKSQEKKPEPAATNNEKKEEKKQIKMQATPRFPVWLKKKTTVPGKYRTVAGCIAENGLNTVCSEARCPNRAECFSAGTATYSRGIRRTAS